MDYYGLMPRIQRQIQTLASALLLTCALGASAQTKEPESAEPINSALDKILFYQILLGELNAQTGEPGAAYSLMLDAARKANDAKLYQRAVELALEARQGESALQAARAWRQALPNSREANAFLLQILVGLNRIGETVEPLKRELAATDPKDRPAVISTIPRFFSRATDKKLASSVVEQVLADYLSPPNVGVAALTTMGRMRLENGDTAGAMEAATRAQALSPLDEGPALLALLMISPKTPQAEAIVKKYLDGTPRYEVRMDYARTLLDAQRYAESAEQLQRITTERPDYSPAWLVRGSLEFQDNKPAAAEKSLKRYIELASAAKAAPDAAESGRGLTQAYLLLAQIAEQRKDYAQAEQWLSRIDSAEDMIRAQTRRASILARQGKLEEGRKLLKSLPERNPEEVRAKLAAEVQLLRDSKQNQTAYDLLVDATTRYPKDLEFVYDQAMLAEKLGRLDEMERLLRGVIAAKPDYHHAYNALGYSLADRNVRLPEAKKLDPESA